MAFAVDHDRANNSNARLFWRDVYEIAFPGYLVGEAVTCIRDQVRGIDRVLTGKCGRTITVEEKIRYVPYGDIALEDEHIHADGRRQTGWIEKDLSCDYLAYGVLSSDRSALIIPYREIANAWNNHKCEWRVNAHSEVDGFYYARSGRNYGYVSGSVCIPIHVIVNVCPGTLQITPPKRAFWGPKAGQII